MKTNKKIILWLGVFGGLVLFGLAVGIALGQGWNGSSHTWRKYSEPYDPKTPPGLSLAAAYEIALKSMGRATNKFYCIEAGCVAKDRVGWPGWTFAFSGTNGEFLRVRVHFDKDLYIDPPSQTLIDANK